MKVTLLVLKRTFWAIVLISFIAVLNGIFLSDIRYFFSSIPQLQRLKRTSFRNNSNEIKYIMDWTMFFGVPLQDGYEGRHFMEACPEFNCKFISRRNNINDADAVVFHAWNLNLTDLPLVRSPDQYYVFYSWEPPTKTWVDPKFDGFFNLTMSYRLDSDFFSPYGNFGRISRVEGEKLFVENNVVEIVRNKTKLVAWFVSNCDVHSKRHLYVEALQKLNVSIDIYGQCGTKTCKRFDEGCFDILGDYKFYLSFENSVCKDYVTEKLFERISYLVVPIVLNSDERSPYKSVISVSEFESVQKLAEYLDYLDKNETAYLEYFEWRKDYSVNSNWRNGCENQKQCAFCALCDFLHRKNKNRKVVSDIHKWWHEDSCDSTFVPRLLNIV